MLKDNERWLGHPAAKDRYVTSLNNWLDGNGSIARSERQYLQRQDDLFSLVGSEDTPVVQVEDALTDCLAWLHKHFRRVRGRLFFSLGLASHLTNQLMRYFCKCCGPRRITHNEHVFVFGPLMTAFSRASMSLITTTILVTPIIVLEFLTKASIRLVVITLASAAFVFAITLIARARTVEVLAAGAASVFLDSAANFNNF